MRSDGISETSSGFFAVHPNYASGEYEDGISYFDFRNGALGPKIRVEWQTGTGVALLPPDIATIFIARGYGRNLRSDEVDAFNEAVDILPLPTTIVPATPAGEPTPVEPVIPTPPPALEPVVGEQGTVPATTGPETPAQAAAAVAAALASATKGGSK